MPGAELCSGRPGAILWGAKSYAPGGPEHSSALATCLIRIGKTINVCKSINYCNVSKTLISG